jgi:Spy/CpxP family protein refolding chaperone
MEDAQMRTILVSLVTVLGLAAVPVAAQMPQGGPPAMAPDSATLESLALSADQRAKIQPILAQLREQNAPLREQMRQALGGKSYRDLSPAERDSLRSKVQPIRQQMMENARKAHQQIAALLTPEQRQKLEQHMRERMGRMEGGPPPN